MYTECIIMQSQGLFLLNDLFICSSNGFMQDLIHNKSILPHDRAFFATLKTNRAQRAYVESCRAKVSVGFRNKRQALHKLTPACPPVRRPTTSTIICLTRFVQLTATNYLSCLCFRTCHLLEVSVCSSKTFYIPGKNIRYTIESQNTQSLCVL